MAAKAGFTNTSGSPVRNWQPSQKLAAQLEINELTSDCSVHQKIQRQI